jgi:MscS family membrane protein
MGTVESIGLRSTRVRTPDRTVVTIPNAQMAEARVESFAERDRIRFKIALGVTYDTTGAQLKQVLDGIRAVLTGHPRVRQVEKDDIVVRFLGFGPSSLDIEVVAWFETTDFYEFRGLREEVLMSFVRVVEDAGSSFAFPTHTVHVKESPARAPS